MFIEVLQAKIHNVRLTQTELNYTGSITIDENLIDAAGMLPNQKVMIVNNNNGERFETYVIFGEPGQRGIQLNGATAHLGKIGDRLTIMSFGWYDESAAAHHAPAVILLDADNRVVR